MKNLLQTHLATREPSRVDDDSTSEDSKNPLYTPRREPTIDTDFYRFVDPMGKSWALPKDVFVTLENWEGDEWPQ